MLLTVYFSRLRMSYAFLKKYIATVRSQECLSDFEGTGFAVRANPVRLPIV